MPYLLDTNTCIGYLKGRAISIRRRLEAVPSSDVFVCSIVKRELFYGAKKSSNPQRTLTKQLKFLDHFVSLPFDDMSALIYGQIRAQLAALGTPIGSNDLLIAAIALTS